jgi:hypothetical protein
MKAADFDKKFDDNEEDIVDHLDLSRMQRPGYQQKPISVDFPTWMIEALDREAERLGVTRQSIIKIWISEKLEHHCE